MTRFTSLISFAVSLMLLSASAMAQEVRLRSGISVQGDFVHIGDLFSNAGDKSTVRIAYAPAPGKKAVFNAQWLFNVARSHSLPWRPLNLNARSVVEREGQIIHRDEIEDKLVAALADYGIGKDVDVDFGNRLLRLFVPIDRPASVSIETVSFAPSTGRFSATVAAPANDPSAQRMRIAGRVYQLESLPVLNKRMGRSDIIKKSDVEWIKVRTRNIRSEVIRDPAELIGQSPRRIIQSGAAVRKNEVQRPVLVPKRSLVTVLHQTPLMRLTARGRALEDGGMGDIIRIANATSKKVIEAEVTGFNRVTVRTDENLASR